jgi:hypothetical protein
LASISAKQGYDKIGAAGYLGTHWLSTYAMLYENLVNGDHSHPISTTAKRAAPTKKDQSKSSVGGG